MNGSCGRMGDREWYHESRSRHHPSRCLYCAPTCSFARVFTTHSPPGTRPTRELARRARATRGRPGEAGARGAAVLAERGERSGGGRGRAGAGGRRSRWACASPTACRCSWRTRPAGTWRRSTRAGAASSAGSCARGSSSSGEQASVGRIGPCIGACCFEVGRDVGDADRLRAATRARGQGVRRPPGRGPGAAEGARRSTTGAIEDVPGCTRHDGGALPLVTGGTGRTAARMLRGHRDAAAVDASRLASGARAPRIPQRHDARRAREHQQGRRQHAHRAAAQGDGRPRRSRST